MIDDGTTPDRRGRGGDTRLSGAPEGLSARPQHLASRNTPWLVVAVLVAEILTMEGLRAFGPRAALPRTLLDGAITATIVFALVYVLVVRPFATHLGKRERFENALEEARAGLEAQVAERTTALRESERLHRALVEAAPDAIIVHRAGEIVYSNPAALQLAGATSPEALLGRHLSDLVHPKDRPAIAERLRELRPEGPTPLREMHITRLDGTVVDIEGTSVAVEHQGRPAALAIIRDIRDRKRSEETIARALADARDRTAEVSALLAASRAVLERRSFEAAAKVIFDSCKELIGATAGYVAASQADESAYDLVYFDPGEHECTVDLHLPMPIRGLRAEAHRGRRTVFTNDFPSTPGRDLLPDGHVALDNVLFAPLVIGEKVVGVLGLANKPGGFSEKDARLATAFAEMASVALLNSRNLELLEKNQEVLERQVKDRTRELTATNEALRSEIEGRKEAEEAREAERARLFRVLDQLPAFVYLRALDGTVVFVNRYFVEAFGRPEGRRCYEVLGRSDTPCVGCDFQRVFTEGEWVEWEWTAADGKSYEVHHYPFVEGDGARLVLALGVDVTERKRAYHAEQVARRTADTLREASLGLTRTLDVDAVLLSLLSDLHRLVPFDRAKVMLLNEGRLTVRAMLDADGAPQVLPEPRQTFPPSENPVIEGILTTRTPVLVSDIQEHPTFGSRADPSYEHCWLGVPLVARGAVIGLYSLGKRNSGSITVEDQRIAEALAAQAAVAIENALLFEQVRQARARMQALSRRLVEVQETERRTIARELHDEAGQSLTSILFGLRALEKVPAGNAAAHDHIVELKRTTEAVMEDLHRLATDLRPASLEHLGLVGALRHHLARVETTFGIAAGLTAHGLEGSRLPNALETTLFRIVQEALTNVVRHAHATRVDVFLDRRKDSFVVAVEDDGVGFDPDGAPRSEQLGRVGMVERAEAMGGTLTVASAPGAGTKVVVEVPCADSSPDNR